MKRYLNVDKTFTIKKITFYLVVLFSFLTANAQKENCTNRDVKLVSENRYKNCYFFFRKTNIKKHKRIDQVIDENGKVLVECTMKSTEDHDQYLFKKFQRIVIHNDQIHKVEFKYKNEFGRLTIYNKCGELIETHKIKTEELDEKYSFNSTIL